MHTRALCRLRRISRPGWSTARVGVLLSACWLWSAPLHAAQQFDAVYAFGDSLTDTHNNPSDSPLHWQGLWSNGPLWIEYLSQRLGFAYNHSNNFAISGAQSDDTLRQVKGFVPSTNVSHSLFVVWAGGNDLLQEHDQLWFNDAAWSDQIQHGVGSLRDAVNRLYDQGARHILVPNTVDITAIPSINLLPDFVRDYLRDKVKEFNAELSQELDQVQASHPDLKLYRVDTFKEIKSLLKDFKTHGFTDDNTDVLADTALLDKSFDGPGANYLFWDPIHPTTKAHAIVADIFQAAFSPLRPHLTTALSGSGMLLNFGEIHVTKTYTLQCSTNLSQWDDVQTVLAVRTNQFVSVTNCPAPAFFRLKWTP